VSSADQRNLLEEGLVRHTHTHVHVHTCMLFVPFHERPSIPNKGQHWQLGWKGLEHTYSTYLPAVHSRLVRFTAHLLKKGTTCTAKSHYHKKVIQQRLPGMLKHGDGTDFPLHCALPTKAAEASLFMVR
jgi:hypothetical protein